CRWRRCRRRGCSGAAADRIAPDRGRENVDIKAIDARNPARKPCRVRELLLAIRRVIVASVVVLGIFVADLAVMAPRLPSMGETILGQGFKIGPGGKGSNQSIAAARAGGDVAIITRIGRDTFGEMARKAWAADGVD